ncbi:hypothetical protein JWG42_05180 [Desulfoprunum benzoelyticum]|uniref:Terminase n=1 Tax=Desulfoprunum benzoelyticum TaxID=1506996 RepID=A0A840UR49_9BACT|nr:TerS protein [Desulfoprunum benzoelyticum]MBB5348262.1 hypothetical protein [Desulfoprunum benzoelyticum]MBM9529545.1 hypothetical protein [Desulfoprunum benzoelyticum]
MSKRKTAPANSISEQGKLFRAAVRALPEPPEDLRESDLHFWNSIILSKRSDAWSATDLIFAGILARTMADIRSLQGDIRKEGDIVDGKKNARHDLLDMFVRRSLAISRLIQVHSLATSGRSGDQARKNSLAREARDTDGDDDLIPGTRVQ